MTASWPNSGTHNLKISGQPPSQYVVTDTPGFTIAGFFQPTVLDGLFHVITAKSNAGDTLRPYLVGTNGSATFGTVNSLVFFPNISGTWAVSTTSALTVNHWYFWALTHLGTSTSSTALSVYDLTSPAGLMATSTHGTIGGVDADSSANIIAIGTENTQNLQLTGLVTKVAFWQGVITAPDILAMAYGKRAMKDVQPSQLIWLVDFDILGVAQISSGNYPGLWNAVNGPLYDPRKPPISTPVNRYDILPKVFLKGPGASTLFRKTLSPLGRVGSRQSIGYMNG